MPTSLTITASSSTFFKSALKIEKSVVDTEALTVERSSGTAFAPRFSMFLNKALAVQSSGSVRTTPIFVSFTFWFGLSILGFASSRVCGLSISRKATNNEPNALPHPFFALIAR